MKKPVASKPAAKPSTAKSSPFKLEDAIQRGAGTLTKDAVAFYDAAFLENKIFETEFDGEKLKKVRFSNLRHTSINAGTEMLILLERELKVPEGWYAILRLPSDFARTYRSIQLGGPQYFFPEDKAVPLSLTIHNLALPQVNSHIDIAEGQVIATLLFCKQ